MSLRSMAKKIIDYTIEGDDKVYRLKGTPFTYRKHFTRWFCETYKDQPIEKGKIVFDNYMGKGYGCNCKYVLGELLSRDPASLEGLDLVWVVKDADSRQGEFPKQVRLVEYGSQEAIKEYATAQIWVKNFQMVHYLNKGLVKRDGQTYIQMWHGSFGIKKIEGDCGYLNRDRAWVSLAKKNAAYTDYWISNSSFETQVYKDAFWGAGTILEYGHPRNDIFFSDMSGVRREIRKRYQVEGKKILLYVPTFRDTGEEIVVGENYGQILGSLEKRFGGSWVFALRNHPRIDPFTEQVTGEGRIDVTDAPDIQQLLAAADVVLTDYSSAIFDFLLTGRPGFLLTEDYKDYEKMRGLYFSPEDSPFPVAGDVQDLCKKIEQFDESEYQNEVAKFLAEKGSVEDGKASKRVADLIQTILRNVEEVQND